MIPARNEAPTIGRVVAVCCQLALEVSRVGPVIVVSDGSTDGTDDIARARGAWVVRRAGPTGSKAAAVELGAQLVGTAHVMLVDADCVGLTTGHLRALVGSYRTGAAMSVGVFDYGSLGPLAARFPLTTGQRVLPRAVLLEACTASGPGYGLEARISALVGANGGVTSSRVLGGVGHVRKMRKRGVALGGREWFRMYAEVAYSSARDPIGLLHFLARVEPARMPL